MDLRCIHRVHNGCLDRIGNKVLEKKVRRVTMILFRVDRNNCCIDNLCPHDMPCLATNAHALGVGEDVTGR